jgi:hypothetical protein
MTIFPSYQQTRSILELLYFLSTIGLTGIAAYGLKQISILKRDIHVRNERAAKEQALLVSARFIKSVEYSNVYFGALKAAGMTLYAGPVGDFTFTTLTNDAKEAAKKKFVPFQKLWLDDQNELEAVAASFISGVADEKLGYRILGLGFCLSVRQKYDMICIHRGDGRPERNYWKNTIALYKIWAERVKKEGLTLRLEEIESQLKKSPEAMIAPIGTSD